MSISFWFRKRKYGESSSLISNVSNSDNQSNEKVTDQAHEKTEQLSLEQLLGWFKQQLNKCSDVIYYSFASGGGRRCAVIYIQGIIDKKTLEMQVIEGIVSSDHTGSGQDFVDNMMKSHRVSVFAADPVSSLTDGLQKVLEGHALLLIDREARMLAFPLMKFEKRSISESENEVVIRGPRDAFVEDIVTNITLLRHRLRTPALKTELYLFGKQTQTKVIVAYIEGVCKTELVDELKLRLSRIRIDGVLGSNYIQEFIEDSPYSPFPQTQYTERPDVVAAALLEGRISVFVDSTPIQILAPTTFYMLMQSAEDYYQRYISATWIRWIRYLFLVISLLLPSVYVAVLTYHPEMLPSNLLVTVAGSRDIVPFPAIVEAFMMEISFEALREATVRMPKQIGQAISVLGALVIGTASVQAGLVSAPLVIIVSLTGIASFIIPHYELGLALRVLRFPIMILAGVLGLLGIVCGIILTFLHLVTLRSFGTPYLSPTAPVNWSDWKDVAVRAPWWVMKKRPHFYGNDAENRQVYSKRPDIPGEGEGD